MWTGPVRIRGDVQPIYNGCLFVCFNNKRMRAIELKIKHLSDVPLQTVELPQEFELGQSTHALAHPGHKVVYSGHFRFYIVQPLWSRSGARLQLPEFLQEVVCQKIGTQSVTRQQ